MKNLIKNFPWSNTTVICNRKSYTVEEFVELMIEYRTAKDLGEYLNCDRTTVSNTVKKYFPEFPSYRGFLGTKALNLLGLHQCKKCEQIKEISSFHVCKKLPNGLQINCKDCENPRKAKWVKENKEKVEKYLKQPCIKEERKAYKKEYYNNNREKYREYLAERRARILQRTPVWSDRLKIQEIYSNCPEGYEVDHIIPLQGKFVSGLHVPENLQYLTKEENRQKSNKFEV